MFLPFCFTDISPVKNTKNVPVGNAIIYSNEAYHYPHADEVTSIYSSENEGNNIPTDDADSEGTVANLNEHSRYATYPIQDEEFKTGVRRHHSGESFDDGYDRPDVSRFHKDNDRHGRLYHPHYDEEVIIDEEYEYTPQQNEGKEYCKEKAFVNV